MPMPKGYRRFFYTPEYLADVAQLHGEGLNDREIATRLGTVRNRVCVARKKQNLRCSDAVRKAMLNAMSKAVAARVGALRRYAGERGWPDMPVRAVHILEIIAAFQPLTAKEICERCGMKWGKTKTASVRHKKTTYLSMLAGLGLVWQQRRGRVDGGSGSIPSHYWLTARAMEIARKQIEKRKAESKS